MSGSRMPTQQDVREQGRCGHGFNYGGPGRRPRYCGELSEPGAAFGDCPGHAAEFKGQVREIDRATARVTEVGPRVLRAIDAEHEDPRRAITSRGRAGRDAEGQIAGRRLASRTRRPR